MPELLPCDDIPASQQLDPTTFFDTKDRLLRTADAFAPALLAWFSGSCQCAFRVTLTFGATTCPSEPITLPRVTIFLAPIAYLSLKHVGLLPLVGSARLNL